MHVDPADLDLLQTGLAEVLRKPGPTLTPEMPLTHLGLDSVGVIELVAHVESTLGVEIRDDELVGLRTVADLATLVARVRGAA